MYNRPYPNQLPYHATGPQDVNYYYNHATPSMNQSHNISHQPYQTPFEYFTKPVQPENWPEFMQNPNQQTTWPGSMSPYPPYQGSGYIEQYPMQPPNWSMQQQNPSMQQQNPNFYPPPNMNHTPQPDSQPGFMTQFQNAAGQIDFNKMLSTVGQLAHTVQQVTPVIQQFGSFMKKI